MLSTACSDDGTAEYSDDWGSDEVVAGGKADGLIDLAPKLAYGGEVSGRVGGDALNVFSMKLDRNDTFTLKMTVTSGDLNPHITLFEGTSRYISSVSWNRSGDVLTKVYKADDAGDYAVVARAYRGDGEGEYTITAACDAGPCAGQLNPPDAVLDIEESAECITQARQCAFDRVSRYNGAVGDARAAELWTECLTEASIDGGTSCATACSEHDDAKWHCNDVTSALKFYADQSDSCLTTLDECFSECWGAGWGTPSSDEFWETDESICWGGGLNGNCDTYARSTAACGGCVAPDTWADCTNFCHSTIGAHIDDLDTICDESCEEIADEECTEACEGSTDGDCEGECLDFLWDTIDCE